MKSYCLAVCYNNQGRSRFQQNSGNKLLDYQASDVGKQLGYSAVTTVRTWDIKISQKPDVFIFRVEATCSPFITERLPRTMTFIVWYWHFTYWTCLSCMIDHCVLMLSYKFTVIFLFILFLFSWPLCTVVVCWISVAYPGILFGVGGFNKFSWGQRTERTGIWGQ